MGIDPLHQSDQKQLLEIRERESLGDACDVAQLFVCGQQARFDLGHQGTEVLPASGLRREPKGVLSIEAAGAIEEPGINAFGVVRRRDGVDSFVRGKAVELVQKYRSCFWVDEGINVFEYKEAGGA